MIRVHIIDLIGDIAIIKLLFFYKYFDEKSLINIFKYI